MTFHIVITNNETGETLHEGDACAILASMNNGQEVENLISVDCDTVDFAETLHSVKGVAQEVCDRHPDVATVAMILGLACKEAAGPEAEENEETENNN